MSVYNFLGRFTEGKLPSTVTQPFIDGARKDKSSNDYERFLTTNLATNEDFDDVVNGTKSFHKKIILSNPRLSSEHIHKITDQYLSSDSIMVDSVLNHRNTSAKTLQKIINAKSGTDDDYYLFSVILHHPNISKENIDSILRVPRQYTIAKNIIFNSRRLKLTPDQIDIGINSTNERIRHSAIGNHNTTPEHLQKVIDRSINPNEHSTFYDLDAVTNSPNLSAGQITHLLNNHINKGIIGGSSNRLLRNILDHPNHNSSHIDQILNVLPNHTHNLVVSSRHLQPNHIDKLLNSSNLSPDAAYTIAAHENTTKEQLERLAKMHGNTSSGMVATERLKHMY